MADVFLKIEGIAGESVDDKHKGEIEIESFSWGVSNTGTSTGSGGGAGRAQFEDLTLVAATSSASPQLFGSTATGRHLKEALLTVRKAGEAGAEYYKVALEDVLVSSYHNVGGEGQVPIDQFSLSFGKIEVSYAPQKADGSLDTPITAGWDLKQGKAT